MQGLLVLSGSLGVGGHRVQRPLEKDFMKEQKAKPPPRVLWWSTRESINAEVLSVTAIIETILAVLAYGWIAYTTDIYWPIVLAAGIAPLVLLRSEESVALGRDWFLRWEELGAAALGPAPPYGFWERQRIFYSPVLAGIAGWFLAQYILVGLEGWCAFAAGLIFGLLSVAVAIASSMAFYVVVKGSVFVEIDERKIDLEKGVFAIGVLGGVLVQVILAAVVGAAAIVVAGVVVGAIAGMMAGFVTNAENSRVGFFISAPPYIFGKAAGILFLSLAIRVLATLRHLPAGIRTLPRNFRRLTVCTSPLQEPELVPGLQQTNSDYTLTKQIAVVKDSPTWLGSLYFVPFILVWFVPGWIYRISIKSTTWLWWPLAFLGGPVKRALKPLDFHEDVAKSLWGVTSIALAGMTFCAYYAVLFLPEIVLGGATNPLIHFIGFMFVIDWAQVLPWQWLSLAAAGLSLLIVFWLDYAIRRYRRSERDGNNSGRLWAQKQINTIERVARLRTIVVLAFIALVAGQALLFLNHKSCWFTPPPHVQALAKKIYGTRTPAPPKCEAVGPSVKIGL